MTSHADDYLLCKSSSELPERLRQSILPVLLERFDAGFVALFPELAASMPLTYRALQIQYAAPKIAVIDRPTALNGYLYHLVLEGEPRNLLASFDGDLFNDVIPFEEEGLWLPNELRMWYAITDGFQMSDQKVPRLSCFDLPTPYAGRESVSSYCKLRGYPTTAHLPFSRAVGSKHLDAWIMMENSPQAIFVNLESDEGKLYHVHGDDFKNFYELNNPVNTIDRYCAHVLSGGIPEHFDFRS